MPSLTRYSTKFLTILTMLIAFGCTPSGAKEDAAGKSDSTTATSVATTTIDADIWADNWFALYDGEQLIKEDSVPFNTERSFNTESFQFEVSLPAQMTIIIKDFYENDTGLEYIGSRRQQMGDGGLSAQFFDANTRELIAVSDDSWTCKVIHQAPLNRECARDDNPDQSCRSNIQEAPAQWQADDFDDSSWSPAIIKSAREVRPHGGYRDAEWHPDVKLIWSDDIEVDNVILCRFTIENS